MYGRSVSACIWCTRTSSRRSLCSSRASTSPTGSPLAIGRITSAPGLRCSRTRSGGDGGIEGRATGRVTGGHAGMSPQNRAAYGAFGCATLRSASAGGVRREGRAASQRLARPAKKRAIEEADDAPLVSPRVRGQRLRVPRAGHLPQGLRRAGDLVEGAVDDLARLAV